MEMGPDAILFMSVTWLVVIALNIFCFNKIFRSRK